MFYCLRLLSRLYSALVVKVKRLWTIMCLYVPVIKSQGQHFDGNISVAMSFCLSDYQEAQVPDRNSQEE